MIGIVGIVEPVAFRFGDRDAGRLGDDLEGFEHAVGRSRVERKHLPFGAEPLEVRRRPVAPACFDRQRANARRQRVVVQQLGRAHSGAAGRRRQDALAIVGEENRVDQLGFAARKLGDECDHELVLRQAFKCDIDTACRFGFERLRLLQPLAQLHDRRRQRITPISVTFKAGS